MTPKKIAAFALGPLGGALLGFITLPIITWFFSQQDIGRLAMLTVVNGFCTLLFSLGLDQAYVREFHETKCKPALFKAAILPGLLLLIIILSILLGANSVISLWLFEIDSYLLSLLVTLVILATFISRFLSLILRMNEQGLAYSMSQVLPKLLLILIIVSYVVLSIDKTLINLLLANVAATVFVCIIYAWNTRMEWLAAIKEQIDYTYLKSLLRFGTPLIFGGLAFWGLTATDKILLKELSSYEQLGLYSVAVSFAAAATIFQSVFSTVWAPTVYKWAAKGENLDKILQVNRYVLLAVIILFSLAGLFSWLITLLLPEPYYAVQWILLSCLGYPLLYTLSETTVVGIGVTRRSGFAMLAACIAFIINLLGNWWLIPIYGAAGAAVSTCIAFWVFFIMRTEFAIYLWKPTPRLAMYGYSTLLVAGAVITSLYGRNYNTQLIIFWLLMLFSVLIFFKSELQDLKSWLLKKKS
ncbi:oligosaccharide flippase family protein [Pseudoalteromonas sp. HL-AS2]|uniref:oligosaccharide flippase family protein n=1 Tax=Pseudoalteromonas sp. HL-AS2 TaxID=3071082 RepID=UPI0028159AE8|nr:oligosaccharide flippase family protein [Pseudoalteromonas sp. HL-AS2]WMS94883.1 oligosaccharide flippase family protein [Pseudoalteromonas sp. HL-AS2]